MINRVDIENIEKELKARKAAQYSFSEGGELREEDVKGKSESELRLIISEYTNSKKVRTEEEIKRIVDNLFQKYGKEGDNMIALTCAYVPERKTRDYDEGPLSAIDFNDHEYNKLYYPICSDWECASYSEKIGYPKKSWKNGIRNGRNIGKT